MAGGIEGTIHLGDGRTLAYSEFGAVSGAPAFYFHGWPGSRREGWILDEAARRLGVRLIAVDRPGIGRSTFQPGRRITDWSDDIAQLAEALRIERFAVIGYSGGGPYAAVCACALAARITSVSIISGVAPQVGRGTTWWRRIGVAIARRTTFILRFNLRLVALGLRRAPRFTVSLARLRWSAPDRRILRRPEVRDAFIAELREAFRQGVEGLAHDFTLYLEPWGFDPEQISVPVHLWYGDRDRIVQQRQGRQYAAAIPHNTPHWMAGEGHMLILTHADEIVAATIGRVTSKVAE